MQPEQNNSNNEKEPNYTGQAQKPQNIKFGERASKEKLPDELRSILKHKQEEEEKNIQPSNSQLLYKPITRESEENYTIFLDIIQKILQDQPREFLIDTSNEILSILKLKNLTQNDKKKEINTIIKINEDIFNSLQKISEQVEDFQQQKIEQEKMINLELDQGTEIEINYNTELEQENKEQILFEEEKVEKNFEENFLFNFLQEKTQNEILAREMEQNIFDVLNIQDETEAQNKLIEFSESLDEESIGYIYENRFEIYYSHLFQINKNNENKIRQIFQEITENPNLNKKLNFLLKKFESEEILRTNFESINFDDLNNLNIQKQLTNEQLAKISKKVIPIYNQTENFENFSLMPLKLPKGSLKKLQPGYEEISIPAQEPIKNFENLIKIKNLPEWIWNVFPEIEELNIIQSISFEKVFSTNDNILLSAPTGAGKTIIALLSILGLFEKSKNSQEEINFEKIKIVYIAPMKALVNEIVNTFQKRLDFLGVKVSEFTGDIHLTQQEFEESTIIVSTPEKWDVVSRKASEKMHLDKLKLLIVDEIHLLNNQRGPVLEALIARILQRNDKYGQKVRLIGLSATLPNYKDVGSFLRVHPDNVLYFNGSFRPVPLMQIFIGIKEKKGFKQMMLIKEILYKKISERVQKHQILIFVHSRKETIRTVEDLIEKSFLQAEQDFFLEKDSNSEKILKELKNQIQNEDLKNVIDKGFGIHHAGLSRKDRNLVENLFAQKHISVLVSTATLAWGVNLPAHTVIIKNTQVYSPELGKWTELNIQDILQMLGRAGRPLYDNEGEGIIITTQNMVQKYLYLVNEQLPIESQMLKNFSECLNSEIVGDNITNLKEAIEWFENTYLNIRIGKNPEIYQISVNRENFSQNIFRFKLDLIHTAAIELEKLGLIKYNKEKGLFENNEKGKIVSYFYLKPNSIKIYENLLENVQNNIEIFRLFSLSEEFQFVNIRDEEKLEIMKFLNSVPIPVKGTQDDPKSKIIILLQCYIGKVILEGYAINADMIYISQNAQRIFRAIFALALVNKFGNALKILEICKMVENRTWNVLSPLRQFSNINSSIIRKLEQQELLNWENFLYMSKNQLMEILREEQSTNQVYDILQKFPKFDATISAQPIMPDLIEIEINLKQEFIWDKSIHKKSLFFWIFVLNTNQNKILFQREIKIKEREKQKSFQIFVDLIEPIPPFYFVKIVSDFWLNCEITIPLGFNEFIQTAKFPLPQTFSENSENEQIKEFLKNYQDLLQIKQFNPIQQEVFSKAYNSFENLFIGSIQGNDTFFIGLISLIRLYEEDKERNFKTVIIFPEKQFNNNNLQILQNICEFFKISLIELTGDLQIDIKILQESTVIISSVENFDKLSRNYKKRKSLKEIKLLICLSIHYLGKQSKQYETLLSKMQMYFTLINQEIRFIVLSNPICNFDSICEWLKIKPENCFNFPPSIRKNNIEIKTFVFSQIDSNELFQAMQKKAFNYLSQISFENQKTMIFVDDRKQCRILLSNFLKRLQTEGKKMVDEEEQIFLEQTAQEFTDIYQSHFLPYGAAYFYSSISEIEKYTIQNLFKENIIKLLIISKENLESVQEFQPDILLIMDIQNIEEIVLNEITSSLNYETKNIKQCVIFTPQYKKQIVQKQLTQSWPLESSLNKHLIEVLNQEIASGVISNKQESLDWISWTFFYRRLFKNPNYYYLSNIEQENVSEFLSNLISTVIDDLIKLQFIEEEEGEFESNDQSIIAAFYNIEIPTIYNIFQKIGSVSNWQEIITFLSYQKNFIFFYPKEKEIKKLQDYYEEIFYKLNSVDFHSSQFKFFVLIQKYLQRQILERDFTIDLKILIPKILELLQVFVDCCSSLHFLIPAILSMKMSQLLVQQMWIKDNTLNQLPFFDEILINKAKELNIEDLDGFFEMEEIERKNLLGEFNEKQIEIIAEFANRYPSLLMEVQFQEQQEYFEGEKININVKIERENFEENLEKVKTNGLIEKEEKWWIVICDKKQNYIFNVKKIYIEKNMNKNFSFLASKIGKFEISVMAVCDAYVGCDIESQDKKIEIKKNSEIEQIINLNYQ